MLTFGAGGYGQLGVGGDDDHNLPKSVEVQETWKDVALGGRHTIAITSEGECWSWGSNERGELGKH